MVILRDAQNTQSKVRRVLERIPSLPWLLTKPSQSIEDEGTKRKARFLRTALLTGVIVFPILQITGDPTQGIPVYSGLAIFLAAVYLLSATNQVRLTSAITIITAATLPFVVLLSIPSWTRGYLSFQILTWPVLAALVGSQLLSTRKMGALVAGMNLGLFILIFQHPGIDNADGLESVGVTFAICVLLFITTWTQQYYSKSLIETNRTLAAKRRELEIYTSILRHDLGNDIQMILGGIELSQMSAGEYRQRAHLESTLAAAERMRSLLQMFSLSENELESDILSVLEKISLRAEIAFKGLLVSVDASDEVKIQPPKYGRLVALAFENLLRNSAQHAGNLPSVEITLTVSEDQLQIKFSDDGPGVDEEIRENLFERGTTTEEQSKGLGLYLTKTIIESENGSIELLLKDNPGCCFLIQLPLYNGR
jgi:signal transduction histidine kinase